MISKLIEACDGLTKEERLRLSSHLLQGYELELEVENEFRKLQGPKEKRNIIDYNTDGNLANLTDAATCHQVPMTYNAFAAIIELDLQWLISGITTTSSRSVKQRLARGASLTTRFYVLALSLTIKTKP
jgi:hypothetical protein